MSRSSGTADSDEQCARCAQAGCRASFERLVVRYQVPLVHFLSRFSSSREDAEDATQDTFVRAYQHLDRYDARRPFRPWLFTIAYRLVLNGRRRYRGEMAHGSMEDVATAMPSPERLLIARENHCRLWNLAASALSHRKYSALWLYYAEDMTLDEIAQVLGCTRLSVKAMLFRARRRLASQLVEFADTSGVLARPTPYRLDWSRRWNAEADHA